VASISQQAQIYLTDNGLSRWPEDLDLTVLTEGGSPYLKPSDLIDPWNRPYLIQVPGTNGSDFDIMSYGGNGEPGGEGEDKDINSSVKE
jgi:type II secretory pathway pseudopilin PulG